jgi:hypothetical protein
MSKKITNILSLIEIAENNLKSAKSLLKQISEEKGVKVETAQPRVSINPEEDKALEVVEGYFDGESMIGDNGQIYSVPQNYASKTQLIIGDRMKWILTPEREVFKLIQPADRERVVGTFSIEGENYVCLVSDLAEPVRILKASATFAMKNLGLRVGDDIAIIIPKNSTPHWGAFSSVVKNGVDEFTGEKVSPTRPKQEVKTDKLDDLSEFRLNNNTDEENYF